MEELTANRFRFGKYELDCGKRSLTNAGEPVTLHAKSFDLLKELVENHGSVMSKDELLTRVWPDQFVEENNLTVQISALRKAFANGNGSSKFIATIPGKGYSFVAEVAHADFETEVLIENRSISRITIEEFLPSDNDAKPQKLASGPRHIFGNRFAILGLIAATAIIAIGGIYYWQFGGSKSKNSFYQNASVRQLTTNGNIGMAALSPDGKLFAYTIDDLGQKSLWLGYVDGGNHLQLKAPAEAVYRSMAFAPDGKDLYFSIRDEKNPKFTLYKMPVFGGVEQKVLDVIDNFSLSPDGKQIAIGRTEGDANIITLIPLDDSERRDVASFPKEKPLVFSSIAWSPDGTNLSASINLRNGLGHHEIAVIEIAGGTVNRFPLADMRDIPKTQWLADDSGFIVTGIDEHSLASVPQYRLIHVAYPSGKTTRITTDRSNYGPSWHNDAGATLSLSAASDLLLGVEDRFISNVWVAPADGLAAARQITFGAFGKNDGLWGLDWTPDGRVVYVSSDANSQFISVMNADGSDQKAITPAGNVDSQLTVTRDGRYVVFHSMRSPEMDIFRVDIDGSNLKQLSFGGKGFHPAPSPDGRWVYYKNVMDGKGGLARVPIEGGETEVLNDKSTSYASFSPDGQYFAAAYSTDKHRLAVFSVETNQVIRQFDFPKGGTSYSCIRFTPDSKAVVYRDVNYGYWIQPIGGGEPKRLEGLPKEKFFNFSWSRDGKWFAFVRGQETRDVVLIQNTP